MDPEEKQQEEEPGAGEVSFVNLSPSTSEGNRPLLTITMEKTVRLTPALVQDSISIDEPLEVQLSYGRAASRELKSITVTTRPPGPDSELAAGLLLAEGVIHDAGHIIDIQNPLDTTAARESAEALTTSDKDSGTFFSHSSHLNVVRVSLEPEVAVNISSKAVMAGIPMVAAVGAPCSLAVQVAREFDVIPVGLHRDNRFIVYRGADRIHTNPDCSRREA